MRKLFTLFAFSALATFCYSQGSWVQKTSCPATARYRAASFEVNGKIYMGTGSTGGGVVQDQKDFWSYDVTANTWTQVADLSGPKRVNATACSLDSYGYIGLGWDVNAPLNDWYQYDPVGNTWTQKANFTGVKRFGATGFAIQSTIYVGGGLDSMQQTALSDFYAYDPSLDTWTSKASFPIGVSSPVNFILNNKAYVVTGARNGSVSASTQNIVYDPVMNTWTSKAAYPPGPTFSAIGFSALGYGYVGTGFTTSLVDIMYRYDEMADTWTQETSWPTGTRQWAVCCTSGNRVFVGTGNSTGGNIYNDWWEFLPAVSTGIQTTLEKNQSIYYDQSSGEIVIKVNQTHIPFSVYNAVGKLVFSNILEEKTNRFPWLTSGIFYVSIGNKSASKIFCN